MLFISIRQQCSTVMCNKNENEQTESVLKFENKISSFEQRPFHCYYNFDKVIVDRKYATGSFLNGLLWPCLGLLVAGRVMFAEIYKLSKAARSKQRTYHYDEAAKAILEMETKLKLQQNRQTLTL